MSANTIELLQDAVGNASIKSQQLERVWGILLTKLSQLRGLEASFNEIAETSKALADAGVLDWSERVKLEPANSDSDPVVRGDWKFAWDWAARLAYLERIGASSDLAALHGERLA